MCILRHLEGKLNLKPSIEEKVSFVGQAVFLYRWWEGFF